MLHVIYTAHASDADFQRIEADLDEVARQCPRLVLVLEDVLSTALFHERLDSSLQDLPPDVLFDARATRRNREELARAYASATRDIERGYRAWNEAPATLKQSVFGEVGPFNRRLLAWAAAHGVELVRGETSLEAWLAQASHSVFQHGALAAARGDPAGVWAENRKEFELLSRAIALRDSDTNAQLTRLLRIERRGHDALYVAGALHAVTRKVLADGLESVGHERRARDPFAERFIETLLANTFDDLPAAERERLETLTFLQHRLQMLMRPATSVNDVAQILHQLEQRAAARNATLRQIVDYTITAPAFQNAARALDGVRLRWLVAVAFLTNGIAGGFLVRSEVEEHLFLPALT